MKQLTELVASGAAVSFKRTPSGREVTVRRRWSDEDHAHFVGDDLAELIQKAHVYALGDGT